MTGKECLELVLYGIRELLSATYCESLTPSGPLTVPGLAQHFSHLLTLELGVLSQATSPGLHQLRPQPGITGSEEPQHGLYSQKSLVIFFSAIISTRMAQNSPFSSLCKMTGADLHIVDVILVLTSHLRQV